MSEIRATTISDLAGTGPATLTGQYAAKAWVNFDGTGTVAIRGSGNVSSVTDNGTGDYTINFTAAMADAGYSVTQQIGGASSGSYNIVRQILSYTTGALRWISGQPGSTSDSDFVSATVTR